MRFNPSLVALAAGAFGIGVTEFTPMGMLPLIAADLHISIPVAGLLVSAYAIGVMIGAPLMTLTTGRMNRRTLLVGLMGIFTVGSLLSALANGYWMLLAARVITSFNHGAFFGVGSVVAASLVPPDRRAGAVAAMFSGLTIAMVGELPLAAWIGDVLGWRAAFGGIAVLGAAVMLALRLALPSLPATGGGDMRAELRVLARGPVLGALALTTVGFGGMFTVFTYIVPILHDAMRVSTGFVTAMLVLFGVGATIGNALGGRLADRSVDRTLAAMLGIVLVVLIAFAVLMRWPWPAAVLILVWGFASFAIVPPLQMRVMEAAADAPNLASAMNIGAFNLGNAIGAAVGGAVIAAGLGYPAVSLSGAGMAALALAMLFALSRRPRGAASARYPLGVVAAITPWNYPLLLLMVKMAPALITGNTVIAKPSPTTPLTTLLRGEIAASILPAGVFQTLVDQNDLGELLSRHPDVAHVSFTGSTPTGKKVLASAADTLKRFTLELGGNDAAIILDDADVDTVAPAIFKGATTNAGQICLAVKRVYAPTAMIERLCEALAELARNAIVGDGLQQGTTIGPIQNRAQFDKLRGFLAEAREQGTIVAGGDPVEGDGYFITPTIVRDLPDDARLVREEQFGPILPVLSYDDLDDVITRANDSEFGLGGTIWTSDVERGIEVASRIESGTVWVNKHLQLPFDVPFGGAKQSGIGRQQGIEGLEDFTQARIVNAALR